VVISFQGGEERSPLVLGYSKTMHLQVDTLGWDSEVFIDIVELGSTFTNHVPMEVMGTISSTTM
jgi:hypothetical protein